MTSTEKAVQRLVAALDYPMLIVTAAAEGERRGCLVGFTTQCSIHPPRFLVCISQRNATHAVALRSSVLGVHYLRESDTALAELFGEQTADEVDKFELCAWDDGPEGVPLLQDVAGWFAGEVVERHDAGDHTAFLVAPRVAEWHGEFRPLGFQAVKGMSPGHEA